MRQDIIDHNKQVKESAEAGGVYTLEQAGFSTWNKIHCPECGGNISPATLKYYDWNVESVRCYDCQLDNK